MKMIEINLLPEEMRKKKNSLDFLKFDFEADKIKLIGGSVLLGIVILCIVIPTAGSFIRKKQIRSLILKQQELSLQTTDIKEINNEINLLRSKMGALNGLTQREFLWAKKFNELSDLVLPSIWFTRIKAESGEQLVVEGSVISKKEDAMASVGKFMKNIREHNSFFKDFSNIKLESVQRKNAEKSDIVEFRIVLYFKI